MRKGFSLVEVIIAMTMLSIGMLSIAAGALFASRLLREAELREEMLARATSVLDSLLIHEINGAGISESQRYELVWSATDRHVEVTTRLADSTLFTLRTTR